MALSNSSYLNRLQAKLFRFMSIYEEAIGLKEIRDAQTHVLVAEKKFSVAQTERRTLNAQLADVQTRLRSLRDDMDRLSRTDSRYLALFTDEHAILKREVDLRHTYKQREDEERDLFYMLSAALRDSQERERARAERVKYLQLAMSVACTVLGVISAYLVNYFRSNRLGQMYDMEQREFGRTQELVESVLRMQSELQRATSEALVLWRESNQQPHAKQQQQQQQSALAKNAALLTLSAAASGDTVPATTPTTTPSEDGDVKSTTKVATIKAESVKRTESTLSTSQRYRSSNSNANAYNISIHPYVLSCAIVIGFILLQK